MDDPNRKLTTCARLASLVAALAASGAALAAAPEPFGATPTAAQLSWHEVGLYGLVCYHMATFTNEEWAFGDTPVGDFNPTDFCADHLVLAARAGGLRGLVLVAKHHDGFCLWPTETTGYGELYFMSIGRGAALNLGLPPMPSGRLHPADVESLRKFGQWQQETFTTNLAQGARVTARYRGNENRFAPGNLLDGERETYWSTDDGDVDPEFPLHRLGKCEWHFSEPGRSGCCRRRGKLEREGCRGDAMNQILNGQEISLCDNGGAPREGNTPGGRPATCPPPTPSAARRCFKPSQPYM
jgi:hypothetical protein